VSNIFNREHADISRTALFYVALQLLLEVIACSIRELNTCTYIWMKAHNFYGDTIHERKDSIGAASTFRMLLGSSYVIL
jgi:hypothetical protein